LKITKILAGKIVKIYYEQEEEASGFAYSTHARVTCAAVTRAFNRLINASRGGLITFHAPGAAAREIDREKTQRYAIGRYSTLFSVRRRELHMSHDAVKYRDLSARSTSLSRD